MAVHTNMHKNGIFLTNPRRAINRIRLSQPSRRDFVYAKIVLIDGFLREEKKINVLLIANSRFFVVVIVVFVLLGINGYIYIFFFRERGVI